EAAPSLPAVARQIILGQVRPVDGRGVLMAEHHDAALELLAPEPLRRRETRRAAAHDYDTVWHDPLRRLARALAGRGRPRALLADKDFSVALDHRPAIDRIERGRARG